MKVEPIKLEDELRRIADEMDWAGSHPTRQYACSKYDSDLLRDAAQEIEALRQSRILVASNLNVNGTFVM